MKTIVLRTTNNQLFVEVKTDLMGDNENFTIMTISGKTDAAVKAGLGLQELPSSVAEMKDFAQSNNLLMDIVDISPDIPVKKVVTSVTDLAITSSGSFDNGTEGTPYNTTVEVEGGNGPLVYEVTDGALPVGFELDRNTGTIHGVCDTAEDATFEVTVADAFGQSVVKAGLGIEITA